MNPNWKNWKEKPSDLESEGRTESEWNIKKDTLQNLAEKLKSLQNALGYVKIYDRNAMNKIIPMFEIIYGMIKKPLEEHFPQHAQNMNIAFTLTYSFHRRAYKWINSNSPKLTEEVIEFVKTINYLYECLNEAIYDMGLGLTFKKGMSKRDMIDNALQ